MTREQMIEKTTEMIGSASAYQRWPKKQSLPYRKALATSIVNLLDPEREPGTIDDKLRPGQTVKEALDRCIEIVDERLRDGYQIAHVIPRHSVAAYEFAEAIKYMELAQMRYARGRHMQEDSFSPSTVDRWLADGADVQATVDERDRVVGKNVDGYPSARRRGGDTEEG